MSAPARKPMPQVERRLPKLAYKIMSDGIRVGVATRFFPDINKAFKALKANWLPGAKMWMFPASEAQSLAKQIPSVFGRYSNSADISTFPAYLVTAVAHPQKYVFSGALDIKIFRLVDDMTVMMAGYDRAITSVAGRYMGFDRDHKVWAGHRVPIGRMIEDLAQFAAIDPDSVYIHPAVLAEFDPDEWRETKRPTIHMDGAEILPSDNGQKGNNKTVKDQFSKALEIRVVDPAVLDHAMTAYGLYDYQRAGVEHLLQLTSSLLADDMGLGKTRQSVVASRIASAEDGLPVLIACPASLRINWSREIRMIDQDARVSIVGEEEVENPGWIITSYEQLGKIIRPLVESGDESPRFSVMITDEAHYLKEHTSARTQNAFVAVGFTKRCFLLTGTPVLNREEEVHTLLRLSGHPIGEVPLLEFKRIYAGSEGARTELSLRIAEWMLRRKKGDVLKTLKGKHVEQIQINPPDGFMRAYETLRDDPDQMPLVKIGKARRLLEDAKLDFVVQTVQGLGEDDKIIVFCQFLASVETLSGAFEDNEIRYVRLTGSDSLDRRQKAVDAFQQDPSIKVFLATTDAAYAGINLTAANYVIFASLPWTPAKKSQAEDRAYRNGQERPVIVLVPTIGKTMDEDLLKLLEHKQKVADDIVSAGEIMEEEKDADVAAEVASLAGFWSMQ